MDVDDADDAVDCDEGALDEAPLVELLLPVGRFLL